MGDTIIFVSPNNYYYKYFNIINYINILKTYNYYYINAEDFTKYYQVVGSIIIFFAVNSLEVC